MVVYFILISSTNIALQVQSVHRISEFTRPLPYRNVRAYPAREPLEPTDEDGASCLTGMPFVITPKPDPRLNCTSNFLQINLMVQDILFSLLYQPLPYFPLPIVACECFRLPDFCVKGETHDQVYLKRLFSRVVNIAPSVSP